MNIKIGQAIEYKNKYSIVVRGVVTKTDENFIEFFEVKSVDRFTKCYDDPGAVYETDADKVRLKDCPLPFNRLTHGEKGGVYALADINNPIVFTKEQCEKYHVTVLDGGATISDRDMDEIFNHPWVDQKQKELKHENKNVEFHNSRPLPDLSNIQSDTEEEDTIYKD